MVSKCAVSTPEQIVDQYIKFGYSTVVITDHLNECNFLRISKTADLDERIESFLLGYKKVKEAAGDRLNVLLGAELSFNGTGSTDFLIYGATEEFFRKTPDLYLHDRHWASAHIHNNGLLFYQAHPFRFSSMLCEPHLLDGIEVYNGQAEQNSHNNLSEEWVRMYPNLKVISGTDHHGPGHYPTAGIYTDEPITSNEQLMEILRSGNYSLIRDEETRNRCIKEMNYDA